MEPELSLKYDEALRWPVTEWRQCGGSSATGRSSGSSGLDSTLVPEWGPGA